MGCSASRGGAHGTPAQHYQALGIFSTARTGKCFLFRGTVHRAARKVTGLINLVQGCGTAGNCLAWGSPSCTAQQEEGKGGGPDGF